MKKLSLTLALVAVACGSALAQAPSGTLTTPPSEVNPAASGGKAAAAAQTKSDAKVSNSAATPASPTAGSGGAAATSQIDATASGGKAADKAEMKTNMRRMDSNGDGMVSRKEWDSYHAAAWTSMKPMQKNGSVSNADMDATNRGMTR